jgi:hypothetical protein
MTVATDDAGTTDAEEIAPITLARMEKKWSKPETVRLRNPDALVLRDHGRYQHLRRSVGRKGQLIGKARLIVALAGSALPWGEMHCLTPFYGVSGERDDASDG